MIRKIFDGNSCKDINIQGFSSNLGWFQPWKRATPVFIADRVYSFDAKPVPDDFGDLSDTFFIPRESNFCIGPKGDFTEDDWKERVSFLKEMVLTDLRLEIIYLVTLSACVLGYVELGAKKVPPVLGLLTGNNVQMAEWLAASVIGNPTVLLHAILYREDIYSGIPVVITEHDQLVADYSIVLSPTCYERPLTFELPVPQPASKKELNRFCRMAEQHFGTDLARFAETMTSMSMIDLDRLFAEQCAIFEGKDNLDDQFKTVCGAILTTMTITEKMTGLSFHRDAIIKFLNNTSVKPFDEDAEY